MNRQGKCLMAAALMVQLSAAYPQSFDTPTGYPIAFDPATASTRTDRVLTSIRLGDATLQLPQTGKVYTDLSDRELVVRAGDTVWPSVGYSGQWMQAYIFVDLDDNGCFDVMRPGAEGQLAEDNELISFAGMNLDGGTFNSAGAPLANLAGVQPPTFTVPETLAPGRYMMRWKVDWNNCDPAGRMDETNSIIANGGAIVDVVLRVTDEPRLPGYHLVFADEFDLPDGSRPDPEFWSTTPRSSAVWNRWTSDSQATSFTEDGHLVCRAIPNPEPQTDNVPMLTGAIQTRDKFAFTHGIVEVRLRTNLHTGNFPAAWMMPQPPCQSWPRAGEIDIFESIDSENRAYHTVHSHWTYDLGHKNEPASSFSTQVYVGQWHIYGLEWTADKLTWTVDGRSVGSYERATSTSVLEEGQWPFDHPFYLILNQSVGNGSWAKAADTSYTYETQFDWVRVYQEDGDDQTGLSPATIFASGGEKVPSHLYDLSGRLIGRTGSRGIHAIAPGLYIHKGKKYAISSPAQRRSLK